MAYVRIHWLSDGEIICHSIQLQICPFQAITLNVKRIDGEYNQIQFSLHHGLAIQYFQIRDDVQGDGLDSSSTIHQRNKQYQEKPNGMSSWQTGENTMNSVRREYSGLDKDLMTSSTVCISLRKGRIAVDSIELDSLQLTLFLSVNKMKVQMIRAEDVQLKTANQLVIDIHHPVWMSPLNQTQLYIKSMTFNYEPMLLDRTIHSLSSLLCMFPEHWRLQLDQSLLQEQRKWIKTRKQDDVCDSKVERDNSPPFRSMVDHGRHVSQFYLDVCDCEFAFRISSFQDSQKSTQTTQSTQFLRLSLIHI